jgi:glutaredoxin
MSQPSQGNIDCPHCHATPATMDVCITVGREDGTVVAIRHTKDCVDYPPETERPGEEPAT